MKRPFSILTLSDLHVDNAEQDRLAVLEKLPQELHNWIHLHKDTRLHWMPDYVAIPGDIVDCHAEDRGVSYCLASKKIDNIVKRFSSLNSNKVIVAPGNHDRMAPPDSELKDNMLQDHSDAYEKRKANFLAYCLNHNDCRVANEFCNHHHADFEEFCKFNKQFVADADYCDWTNDSSLRYTSVLKIFPELNVCFLSVNTEWLYTRSKINSKEELQLAYPAIMPMITKLNGLTHYTTITLMHRKPDSLSWKDNNGEDMPVHSSLTHIKRCSDIIISGHDHNLRTGRPDVIENRVQHFKLGSPSCGGDNEFKYSVSVIHVNPINHTIKLLRGEYLAEGHWDFNEEVGTFPLRNKYIADAGLDIGDSDKQGLNTHTDLVHLQARYLDDEEIERTIKDYFYVQGLPDRRNLKPVCVDSTHDLTVDSSGKYPKSVLMCLKSRVIRTMCRRNYFFDTSTHIVLYSHSTDKMSLGRLKNEYDNLCNDPDMQKRRLLRQLIVSKVIVEIPQNKEEKDRH